MVQNTVVWLVIYSGLQSFGWWLMRLTKNSHFFTLFHTLLHPDPTVTTLYAFSITVTERVLTHIHTLTLDPTAGPLSYSAFNACLYAV